MASIAVRCLFAKPADDDACSFRTCALVAARIVGILWRAADLGRSGMESGAWRRSRRQRLAAGAGEVGDCARLRPAYLTVTRRIGRAETWSGSLTRYCSRPEPIPEWN